MIIEKVYEAALPGLQGKSVKEIRIGLSLLAVELDDGSIGVTYVLRKEIDEVCEAIQSNEKLEGALAEEIGKWALQGHNVIKKAIGLAVLNSVADFKKLEQEKDANNLDAVFSAEIKPDDTVGVVGHIGPVITKLYGKVKRLIIFERGQPEPSNVYPESAQPELLPECQVVFVTSATLINGTLDGILSHCKNAREVIMVGSSTPMYPQAFRGTKVTALAGTRWLPSNRDMIFTGISHCSGMKQLIKNGQKVTVRIKPCSP